MSSSCHRSHKFSPVQHHGWNLPRKKTNVLLTRLQSRKYPPFTFDLDPRVMVIQNVAQYPLYQVAYSGTKFEFATSNGLGGVHLKKVHYLTFDCGVKVTQNVTSNVKVKGLIMIFLLNVPPKLCR